MLFDHDLKGNVNIMHRNWKCFYVYFPFLVIFSEFVDKMAVKLENKLFTAFKDEWVPGFMEIVL